MQNITFEENKTPKSKHFGDIYYNIDGGLDEKYYVFIQANKLPEKFSTLKSDFNILELGFGTGLSFLLTALEFNKCNDTKFNLNFTSTELYPLSFDEIDASLKIWDNLYSQDLTKEFLAQYKQADLSKDVIITLGNINLHILIGDARETLGRLEIKQNCFYLDGFAPSKNPVMWGEEVFTHIKRLALSQASATTYSVSRLVKDILTFADFSYYKEKGFAKKRHMMVGIKN